MVLKNLFTGQQWRNREYTYGHGERGGEDEMYGKGNMETYITICKTNTTGICCMPQETQTGSLYQSRGVAGAGDGREIQKGRGVYVYLWPIHVEV